MRKCWDASSSEQQAFSLEPGDFCSIDLFDRLLVGPQFPCSLHKFANLVMEQTNDGHDFSRNLCIELAQKACADESEWKLVYDGKTGRIWVKPSAKCDFHSIKVSQIVDYDTIVEVEYK